MSDEELIQSVILYSALPEATQRAMCEQTLRLQIVVMGEEAGRAAWRASMEQILERTAAYEKVETEREAKR